MAIIFTTKGDMDESLLEKREGVIDNAREHTKWVEYWHENVLVHRSVHVTIKEGAVWAAPELAQFG